MAARSILRRALIVGFLGASLWALSPLLAMVFGVLSQDLARVATAHELNGNDNNPFNDLVILGQDKRARRLVIFRSIRDEVVVLTAFGMAWCLVPLYKAAKNG